MSLHHDVRHGLRIGRAEFVRSFRGYLGNTRRLVGLAIVVLFFGGSLLVGIPAAYFLGRTARSAAAIPFFAPAATALPVALVLLSMFRTLERIGNIEAEELMLLAAHPRAIVIGLITAEIGRLFLWFGFPLGGFIIAFALGVGSPLIVVSGGLIAIPLVCCAAVWGYASGIGVLRLLERLPSMRRFLKASGVLAMIGLVVASQFAGQFLVEADISIQQRLSVFTFDPLVEYIALTFIGTPIAGPISLHAGVVLAAVIVLTPIGLSVSTRQASALWFTETVHSDATTRTPRSRGGFSPPQPFAWSKAGRIAWGILLRGRRHPQELNHLLMAVFFIAPFGTAVVQLSSDAIGPIVAVVGVGLATYFSGAAFGLNPFGDEQSQFPLLLLTETSATTMIRGRLLSGIAIGFPFAVFGPLASVFFGLTVLQAAVTTVIGSAMCLTASMFAVGLGSAYPIYEEREFWGTKTVVPSTLVMTIYVFVVGPGTILGLLATWFAVTGNLVLTPVFSVFFSFYLLLTGGVSYASYRYAIRRYRRYSIE